MRENRLILRFLSHHKYLAAQWYRHVGDFGPMRRTTAMSGAGSLPRRQLQSTGQPSLPNVNPAHQTSGGSVLPGRAETDGSTRRSSPPVPDSLQLADHGRPVGSSVQQGSNRVEVALMGSLVPLVQVNILNALPTKAATATSPHVCSIQESEMRSFRLTLR